MEVDYFAQDQYKALDPDARLIDDLASVAPAALSGQTQLRTLLGCFLFSDDEVFKRIGVLSGGERNRYALARMLLRPPNFLLLDEPTNHLDLQAKDVLLEALRKFTGTVVFVSHDRYFIDKLATRIFEIEGGELHDYPGNYEDYLWQKERADGRSSWLRPANCSLRREARGRLGNAKSQKPQSKKLNPILIRKMRGAPRRVGGRDRALRSGNRRLRTGTRKLQERAGIHPPRQTDRRAPHSVKRDDERLGANRARPGRAVWFAAIRRFFRLK